MPARNQPVQRRTNPLASPSRPQGTAHERIVAPPRGGKAPNHAVVSAGISFSRPRRGSNLALVSSPERLADVLLEHLAVGAAGKRLDEHGRFWSLDTAEFGSTVGQQLLFGQPKPIVEFDNGGYRLSPVRMRDTNHRTILDRGVRPDDLFDLAGIYVKSSGDDQVLLSVCDVEEAFIVEVPHVAGVQPAIDNGFSGLFRGFVVPVHHQVAAYANLAGFAGRKYRSVLAEDLTTHPRRGPPGSG